MKIGNININGYAVLAPMAGLSDRAFRELCSGYGASLVVSEMVSSNAIYYNDKKTAELMHISELERPSAIQIFGNDPKIMAYAAKKALQFNPDIIDINMGCPAHKIVSGGYGCSLMKDPKLCGEIVKEVKNTVNIPVTVKIRKGFDNHNINAVEIAKICEQMGVDAIIIHGRTREQMYNGKSDLETIAEVKRSVKIPVIGNGDIKNAIDAKTMLDYTGCDLVMVGRGALGNPWIFRDINMYLKHGVIPKEVELSERLCVMSKHITQMCKYKGEKYAMKEARKHICFYIKGIKDAAKIRYKAVHLNSLDEFYNLICEVRQ